MELRNRPRALLEQRQRLGLVQRQALALLALPAAELAGQLAEAAGANPFLRMSGGPPRPAADPQNEAAAQGPSLIAHVLARLPYLLPDPRDRAVALALAEGLDAAGYLAEPVAQTATRLSVPAAEAERALAALQRIEPAGLFARSLAECLRLQLAAEGTLSPAWDMLLARLDWVAEGRHEALAAQCGVSLPELRRMLGELRGLDPKPGSRFSHTPPVLRLPDLLARRGPHGWEVTLNPEALPALALLPKGQGADRSAHQAARRMVTALDLRNRAVLAIGARVVAHQTEALDSSPAALRPLTRRDLAAAVGVHETTVSRIVRHAALEASGRIVPLADLLARAPAPGSDLPRPAIVALLRQRLMEGPATDGALQAWLAGRGVTITRRRVAKYRASAMIPARRGRPARPPSDPADL